MDIFSIAALGMKADEGRLKVISQNLANVLTPGYKAQMATTPVLGPGFETVVNSISEMRIDTAMSIDPRAGALRSTGNANDIAIEGDAFFELESSNGPVYTRQGALHIDLAGRLVGAQGMAVSGVGGAINMSNAPFTISPRGDVSQTGHVVGTLKLVSFDLASKLSPLGDGTYAQGTARIMQQTGRAEVRTGFAEASNVSSTQEMVRLSETVRHFEALSKVVQGYDETLEQTIRKLGEF